MNTCASLSSRRRRIFARGLLAFVLLLPAWLAAQGGTAIVTGRVVNRATGAPLAGASVAVASHPHLSTLTLSDGTFRLANVPAGEQTLTADYTGLDTGRVAFSAAPNGGTNLQVELTAAIYRLEAFNVSAVREGQAMAINQQRVAPNVQNVISTDAFGNVADTNVGNLLIKVPGITPVRDEAEVFRVSVRGINPDLNSVSVDGTLLAGATTRGNDRSFEIDKVSANTIESIEVIKSPTPDMDADSIGGKINLRTKSALDRKGRELNYSLGANVYVPRGRAHPSAGLVYSDILGAERRLGITLSASFNRTFSPRSAVRGNFLNATFAAPAAVSDFQHAEDDIRLDRTGVGARFDYKLGDRTRLFVNTMYNNFKDVMRQHKYRVRLTGSGVVTRVDDLVTEFRNGQAEYEMESRTRTVKTGMAQVGGKTEFNRYRLDYDLSTSRSTGSEKREDLSLRINGVGYRVDFTNRVHFPVFTQLSGPDVSNYDNAFTDSLNQKDFLAWDRVTAGQVNLRRDFDTTWPTYLKTGFRYRSQEKRQDRNQDVWTYVGPDGRAGAVNGVSDDNLNRFRDDGHRYSPVDGRYPRPIWPNWDALHEERRRNPQLFLFNANSSLQNALANDNTAGEDIYAGYFMGNVKIGSLSALGGVRIERTDTRGTGPVIDRTKTIIAERYAKTKTVSGSYTDTFPGLHLRYELAPRLLLRASTSTSIGRPNFSQLVPATDIDLANNIVRQNNPSLKPQFSDNYDLSAEYYSRNVGLFSVGLFRKNIVDFAFNVDTVIGGGANNGFDGLYEGYMLRTRTNGGWAHVKGLELNYQQQLSFLPPALNGFGVYANATFLRTQGTYDGTAVLSDIAGFVRKTGNVGVSYIKHGLTIRSSLNYVGRHMTSFNNSPALRQFLEPRRTVDFSVKYAYRPRLSVFADVNNVFNEKSYTVLGVGYRSINSQVYGVRLTTGISGSF